MPRDLFVKTHRQFCLVKHFTTNPMIRFFLTAAAVATLGTLHAQCDCPPLSQRTDVTITDNGEGTGTTTWTCDNNYILDGYVFVNGGQALTIEAGTIVKGAAGSGVDAAAMIVSAGGQIFAEGTENCPIIFTFEGDALDGSTSYNTRGQWGGLIVLGDATTNFGGPAQVEGIPADNNQATYGGSNDADNSGVLTYVSIRHGGTQLGAANEINGLTLAGVGSGTTIHHVEVVSNLDDGIEFFGGAVTVDQALVAFCGDDSFDWDQGFHGGGSQWLAVQDQPTGEGDRGGELDGDDSDDSNVSADEMPFATPTIEGWTVVGVGGQQGLLFRNGSGGHVSNGLLCNTSEGIEIEDKTDEVEDAYQRFLAGDLTLTNIVVTGGVAALDYDGDAADGADVLNAYATANGVVSGSVDGLDDMFAFDPSGTFALDPLNVEVGQGSGHAWTAGWTFCAQRGLFTTVTSVEDVDRTLDVSLYPNPSSGTSVLDLPAQGVYNVQIFSNLGSLVAERTAQAGRVRMPQMVAGTYVVVISNNEGAATRKWMVQ